MNATLRAARAHVLRRLHALSRRERAFLRAWPRIDAIDGLLMKGQERWLFERAWNVHDGGLIVEVGAYHGRSTAALGSACLGTRTRVVSVDTFDGNDTDFQGPGRRDFFSIWRANVGAAGLDGVVQAERGPSRVVGAAWTMPIDFLFIDASHDYDDVRADFELFYAHVVPGGCVALHDVGTHPGPTRVWAEVESRLVARGRCASIAFGERP